MNNKIHKQSTHTYNLKTDTITTDRVQSTGGGREDASPPNTPASPSNFFPIAMKLILHEGSKYLSDDILEAVIYNYKQVKKRRLPLY